MMGLFSSFQGPDDEPRPHPERPDDTYVQKNCAEYIERTYGPGMTPTDVLLETGLPYDREFGLQLVNSALQHREGSPIKLDNDVARRIQEFEIAVVGAGMTDQEADEQLRNYRLLLEKPDHGTPDFS